MAFKEKQILFVSANSNKIKSYLKLLETEYAKIRDHLVESSAATFCVLEYEPRISFQNLYNKLERKEKEKGINILHYCGHSSTQVIQLEQQGSGEQEIPEHEFAQYLNTYPDLEVVFLNSCSSKQIGERLLQGNHIKAVIVTTQIIHDTEAVRFAELFYKQLFEGKSLSQAFYRAKGDFLNGKQATVNSKRDTDRVAPPKKKGINFSWQLLSKDKTFEETYKLVPKTAIERLQSVNAIKVLCFYPEKEKYTGYFNALVELFARENLPFSVKFYNFWEFQKPNKELIAVFDVIFIFLGEGFSTLWDEKAILTPTILSCKKLGLLLCYKDFKLLLEALQKDGIDINRIPQIPSSYPVGLDVMNLSAEQLLGIYMDDFKSILFQGELQTKLKENLIDLNFTEQRIYFDPNLNLASSKKLLDFGSFNFFHLPGSTDCGHLLFVRKMLSLAGIDITKVEPKQRKAENSYFKLRNSKALWFFLARIFVENEKEELAKEMAKEEICFNIKAVLKNENFILIIEDINKLALQVDDKMQQLAYLKEFWEDFTTRMSKRQSGIKKKFFLFILDTSYCNAQQREDWVGASMKSAGSFVVKTFTPIAQVQTHIFEGWYKGSIKNFEEVEKFKELGEPNIQTQIMEKPFVQAVAVKVCNHLGLEDTSFITNLEK